MTHIGVTLHIVVDLVGALANNIHGGTPLPARISYRIGRRRNHRLPNSLAGAGLPPPKHLPYLILIYWLALVVKLELILRATHAEDLEAVYFWNEFGRTLRKQLRELLQENVRKACAEVGTVYVELFLSGYVDVLAAWAIHLDP